MKLPAFHTVQAEEAAQAFAKEKVDYLFLGKGAAILFGYPGTTQDIDVFVPISKENGRRLIKALRLLGFKIPRAVGRELTGGKDFVQLKSGPFDMDIIHAPDGIKNFEAAKARGLTIGNCRVANLRDIIASKQASGRTKDKIELGLLKSFLEEYEKKNPQPIASASDIAAKRFPKT